MSINNIFFTNCSEELLIFGRSVQFGRCFSSINKYLHIGIRDSNSEHESYEPEMRFLAETRSEKYSSHEKGGENTRTQKEDELKLLSIKHGKFIYAGEYTLARQLKFCLTLVFKLLPLLTKLVKFLSYTVFISVRLYL